MESTVAVHHFPFALSPDRFLKVFFFLSAGWGAEPYSADHRFAISGCFANMKRRWASDRNGDIRPPSKSMSLPAIGSVVHITEQMAGRWRVAVQHLVPFRVRDGGSPVMQPYAATTGPLHKSGMFFVSHLGAPLNGKGICH